MRDDGEYTRYLANIGAYASRATGEIDKLETTIAGLNQEIEHSEMLREGAEQERDRLRAALDHHQRADRIARQALDYLLRRIESWCDPDGDDVDIDELSDLQHRLVDVLTSDRWDPPTREEAS